jgi:hypothetical protein
MQDFEPYFCTAADCKAPFDVPNSFDGLLDHMQAHVFPTQHTSSRAVTGDAQHLIESISNSAKTPHTLSMEAHTLIDSAIQGTEGRASLRQGPFLFDDCPFCGGYPDVLEKRFPDRNTLDAQIELRKHVNQHMQEIAMFLPPCRSDISITSKVDEHDSNASNCRSSVDDISTEFITSVVICERELCDCKIQGDFASEDRILEPLSNSSHQKEKQWVCCRCKNNYAWTKKDSCAHFHDLHQPHKCASCCTYEVDHRTVGEWGTLLESISLQIISSQTARGERAITDIVDDVGDSLQLQDVAKRRFSGNEESAVDYVWTHLPLAENSELPNSISGALDDEPLDGLQLLIRGYMLAAAYSPTSFFLPLSELDDLISIPNIQKELRRSGLTSDVEQIARQVWSPHKLPTGKFTTRRRIFAILCLIDKATRIREFITEDIYDSDLPFEFEPTRVLRRSGALIKHFMQWEIHCRDIFHDYQGRFLAPYFKFTAPKFREYQLHRCVVLPFMEYEVGDKRLSPSLAHYSAVRRVAIHLAHHDYCMISVCCRFSSGPVKSLLN